MNAAQDLVEEYALRLIRAGATSLLVGAVMPDGSFHLVHGSPDTDRENEGLNRLAGIVDSNREAAWPYQVQIPANGRGPCMPCSYCNGLRRLYPGGPQCGHCD